MLRSRARPRRCAWAEARFGAPRIAASGAIGAPFVVIGMGKLGGRELNAGSDIDLLLFYETDDGEVVKDGDATEHTLHEHFTRVAQRFVATLDDATEDGIVWRVDLRLRPEGTRGPLVNALAAAERYYETWGRTWERAALVRARPVAGDLEFGARLLDALGAVRLAARGQPAHRRRDVRSMLVARAPRRGAIAERDLKLGPGGIREVEFFVAVAQLVWGGREPRVRGTNTLDALRRLRARGFVTDREEREVADAYLFLRRLEHRVQFATGLQTHALPARARLVDRIARSLGFDGADRPFASSIASRARGGRTLRVAQTTASAARRSPPSTGCGRRSTRKTRSRWPRPPWSASAPAASPDLPRHLLALARRPD